MTSTLPRLLQAASRAPRRADPDVGGVLVHDVSVQELVRMSAANQLPLAVDLDTVEGLAADATAVAFLAVRLRLPILITRRPALAARARELGCLALLHAHCLDSTGWERAMAAHPGPPVGTAVSPGLVLPHLDPFQLRSLPRPVLAYGLLRRVAEREAAFAAGADSAVVP
ncbi:MAG TPA: glycerol-3-phosphate responsive antiterminator [Candidatus Dormibacteraeota bacterium]|nr:glycerol-3-phosphate responsive antiterminator [Candidatus Dormibacteraeota bacterium]